MSNDTRTTASSENDDVAGPVDLAASVALLDRDHDADDAELALRAKKALAQAEAHAVPALVEDVRAGRRSLAFTFAGQGASYLDDLAELYAAGGSVRRVLDVVKDALVDEARALDASSLSQLPHGIDFVALTQHRPDDAALARASLSAPLLFTAQMARVEQLLASGLDRLFYADAKPLTAGHSQGVLGALALSSLWGVRDIEERALVAARFARAALHLGLAMERSGTSSAPPSVAAKSIEETGRAPTPMAAASGASAAELRALIEASQADVVVAVESAPFHHTLAGAPAELERFRRFAAQHAADRRAKKKAGQAPGRVVDVRFAWLDVSGPFHTSAFVEACNDLAARLHGRGLGVAPGTLRLPVQDGAGRYADDGTALVRAMESILVRPQSFRASLVAMASSGGVVVDCGPGVDVAHLAASALRGRGAVVVSAVDVQQRRALLDPSRAPAAPASFDAYAPVVDADGRLANKFTRATGCPPVFVPGMTPTTVDAAIVVAAANAGYVAELAGGGQVTAPIARARMEEIRATLEHGRGVVWNALYLDPYLWGLHFKKDRIVFKLRDEGYPIVGVTVSAGIPPVDEAVALLDELVAHGLTQNAFKPGNDNQLDDVIAIAKARPAMTIQAHIEGGKAGGHHSWEDLDDLLVRYYAKLRACDNLVVCVGGGIGTEEQAARYLNGTWSTTGAYAQLDLPRMPVDAVFLGTRLMATKEAKTSPAVKAALVSAVGEVSKWPLYSSAGGGLAGGVTSGKSSLDAPIYYLENAAAKCGRLLDEVAGDAQKVAARRDEIVAALAATSKPYFGDVEAMSPAHVLARTRELLTPLNDDGSAVDVDVTWTSRVGELTARFDARYGGGGGADDCLVHPEDARFFLDVCKRPGKPVPFVPVLDADVRRWFKSDSLWQSHDDRYAADAVFSIPGPAAVAAITRANEPVADVLASFVKHVASLAPHTHDARPAAINAAQRASVVDGDGRWHANPLRRLPAGWNGFDLAIEDRGTHLAWDRARYVENQHAFYSRAIFGDVVEAVALFSEAREDVVVDAAQVRAFRAATGDDNAVSAKAPLSMAFPLVWRAVFRALAGARPDVVRLVHESEDARGLGFHVGDKLAAVARVSSVEELEGGRRVVVEGRLERGGEIVASTVSRFFIRGNVEGRRSKREDRAVRAAVLLGDAEIAFLRERGFVWFAESVKPGVHTIVGRVTDERAAAAVVDAAGNNVGRIDVANRGELDAIVEMMAAPPSGKGHGDEVSLREPVVIGVNRAQAPARMEAYAEASGDRNPLHVDESIAKLAGFERPIVHGMWTASLAVHRIARIAADGDAGRVSRVTSTFLAPVLPGAKLVVEVQTTGKRRGATIVKAQVKDEAGVVVVETTADVEARRTAYVFPGQGVQHAGMGMDAYAKSAAARAVWDEADAACRKKHGFSLLHVVRDNPRELWLLNGTAGERLVHPDGVLFLTQLTQVALAVMAVADVEALREEGALVDNALFAGHSLGEYSALASVPAVMPLAGVVDIVYERGRTMDRLVTRDAQGRSPYAMGAVRPNLAGLDEAAALKLVDDVARESGLPLFVVNHNVRGRQYAVTGDVRALAALKARLNATSSSLSSSARAAFVDVPGIDVPFHSPLLKDGVAAFRARLEAVLPARVDAQLLEGRYVPNLTGSVFRLDKSFLVEVLQASESPRVAEWLDCFDAVIADRDRLARMLLVEVLAYQFASPVRWIDVQDVLFAAVGDVVEVGPAKAPVLVGMAKAAADARVRVLHAAADHDVVMNTSMVEEASQAPARVDASPAAGQLRWLRPHGDASVHQRLDATTTNPGPTAEWRAPTSSRAVPPTHGGGSTVGVPVDGSAPAAQLRVPPTHGGGSTVGVPVDGSAPAAQLRVPPTHGGGSTVGAPAATPATPPTPPTAATAALAEPGAYVEDALVTLLCVVTKKARADVDMTRSLDHLLGGNSARRNQVLAEIGAELTAKAVDNAHEMPLSALASTLAKASNATGPGPVLKPLQEQAAHKLLGHDLGKFDDVVAKDYGLSPAHRERLKNRLAVRAKSADAANTTVDAVVADYARELGVTIGKAQAQASSTAVDSAALDALEARVFGKDGVLARLRDAIEPDDGRVVDVNTARATSTEDREHDAAYFESTKAVFDEKKHVAFTSAWAWARRDLFDSNVAPEAVARRLDANGRALALHVSRERPTDERMAQIVSLSSSPRAGAFAGRTALVTGAGAGSIARSVVARLLEEGARVVVTTSRPDGAASFKALYQEHASLGAELHVVPANQGSFADVDDLVRFLATAKKERTGSVDKIVKAPIVPDLIVPFGAIAETADVTSMGPRSLAMFRVLVLGVERLVARVAELHRERGACDDVTATAAAGACAQLPETLAQLPSGGSARGRARSRVHVVLPLSPNHGTFGGDGAYGECKAALEALVHKQTSEAHAWGSAASIVGARIGWVRGTGLMHKNDSAAAFLEQRGLKTFSTEEMASSLVDLMHADVATRTPFVADLTGGLGAVADLSSLLGEHRDNVVKTMRIDARRTALADAWAKRFGAPATTTMTTTTTTATATATATATTTATPNATPKLARQRLSVPAPSKADLDMLPQLDHLDLDELIVVVGTGEVSPWGTARTRWSMERDAKLSIEAVLELAWMMGLVVPDEKGSGFVDATTKKPVADHDVIAAYEKHVLAHAGVRVIEPAVVGFDPRRVARLIEVRLDRDFRFPVPTKDAAAAMVAEDPERTVVVEDGGMFTVVKRAGSVVRVPAAIGVHRCVAGQLPTGWDARRFGVPAELTAQVDPVTLYCLVSTAEAFLAAGLTPEELFAHLHPGRAGVTIGTGIGGMTKLKRLYRDFYDGADRQNDALQETLINVIGGYVVQAFLGSYGPMSFPVGACATAGLSVSEAVDKIRTGQADLVVAGGADDLSEAGNLGFGDMGATADTDDLAARGVEPRFMSRPNDARRRGFVEAQGCGVVVVCRASLAVKLALPVYGVVAFAGTSGDGLQKSVPAPGQGALALVASTSTSSASSSSIPSIVDETACDFELRRRAIRDVEKKRDELARVVGAAQADAIVKGERRRLAHEFARDRSDVSPLRAALATLGLVGDDVGVISKHDSSTQANDLNEARLHETMANALGRSPAKPLFVISQKALTGHPKGAAAAWQMNGLMQAMADGVVPGNRSLDDVDDDMKQFARLVWSDRATKVPWHALKAGFVTTLGFGHVSALVCLAHPFLFWRALDDDTRTDYAARMEQRRRRAEQQLQRVLSGRAPLFVAREKPASLSAEAEARMLVDANARLAPDTSNGHNG